MKRILLLTVILFFLFIQSKAQNGLSGINYQAIARNANGTVLSNQALKIRFSILSGSGTGNVQYQETHEVNTNQLGLFTTQIGKGAPVSGTFTNVPWTQADQYLKVEISLNGSNFSELGISQLMSVPYAMYAGMSGTAGPRGLKGDTGPQGLKGDQGVAGLPGVKGDTGPQGLKGDPGVAGLPGVKGETGPQGLKGDPGVAGLPGVNGDTGPQGLKGDPGLAGIPGFKGETGPQGLKGDPGVAGLPGVKGDTGPQGLKGDPGVAGLPGIKGETGPQGLKGDQGIAGLPGIKGDTGPQGLKGDQGIPGLPGIKGDTGPAGPIAGAAGGDLSGTYPDPEVAKIRGIPVVNTLPAEGQSLVFNGSSWAPGSTGFTLPFSQTVNLPESVFSLTNQGKGTAIEATSTSTADEISALLGTISATNPGAYSCAVKGYHTGTGPYGIGVWGAHDGSGWGVMGSSPDGFGVYGLANGAGTGLFGASNTGAGLFATSYEGVAAAIANNNTLNNNPVVYASTISDGVVINAISGGNGDVVNVFTSGTGYGINVGSIGSTGIYSASGGSLAAGIIGDNSGGGEGVYGHTISVAGSPTSAVVGRNDGAGYGVKGFISDDATGNAIGIFGQTGLNSSTGAAGKFENINYANTEATLQVSSNANKGNVLEVNHTGETGSLAVFQRSGVNVARIDMTGQGIFNGGVALTGADMAESFEVLGAGTDYEPGDVMIIATGADRTAEKSNTAYSSLVIGVYATRPGVLLSEDIAAQGQAVKIPLGVVGVIPTKVCNENGPVRRGDLLVTANRHGFAMKADVDKLKPGQVIGKALQEFYGVEGKIKVMVNIK